MADFENEKTASMEENTEAISSETLEEMKETIPDDSEGETKESQDSVSAKTEGTAEENNVPWYFNTRFLILGVVALIALYWIVTGIMGIASK